jgi:hypothetical protein
MADENDFNAATSHPVKDSKQINRCRANVGKLRRDRRSQMWEFLQKAQALYNLRAKRLRD